MVREVTLGEMLAAREERVCRQTRLLSSYGLPLVSFCMNIPGPIKDSPLIRRGFFEGKRLLEQSLKQSRLEVIQQEDFLAHTGCEAVYIVKGNPDRIKAATIQVEEVPGIGRLFDMDVVCENGEQLRRESERGCLVCGRPGRGCASRRVHTVAELQSAVRSILTDYFEVFDCRHLAACAQSALLDEVCVTPKPGLVDRENSGSHRDMDIFTFMHSAAVLFPYFEASAKLGQCSKDQPAAQVFEKLRELGRKAEADMMAATEGINTHKGAIFTMGTLVCAAGRLWKAEEPCRSMNSILDMAGELCKEAVAKDFAVMEKQHADKKETLTAGERLYLKYGIRGIRGELADGLPSVRNVGMPKFLELLQTGMNRNDAAAVTLLTLIGEMDDTNMITRGGLEKAAEVRDQIRNLMKKNPVPTMEEIRVLDRQFTGERLSPGGCADLLAVILFLTNYCWARIPCKGTL